MSNIYLPNGVIAVEAEYKEQILKEYSGNPLIEALPPILNKEDVIEKIAVYPTYNEKEKLLEPQYRVHAVQRLFQCFQPLPIHLDLESRISRLIRQGYLARNPFNPDFVKNLNNKYDIAQNLINDSTNNDKFRTTASGLTIIGVSGIGKTTAINRILSLMPQIIVHSEYRGIKFSMLQLVWLKIECPYDGSIKQLCIDFFYRIDNLLGTNYYNTYKSRNITIDILLIAMSKVARNIGLGMLVIDEIQSLSASKGTGASNMLNFFVTLINTIGIPLTLIGTSKALPVLQSEFRQARRGSGQGDLIWERMKNDSNWNLLMEAIWDYQWTKKSIQLTKEFIDEFYVQSQGITDIAVKLFAMTQIRAILSGKEEIDVNLIIKVAEENLQLVKPMIDALRSGDIRKLAKYEDIYTLNFEDFFNAESQSINLNKRIKDITDMKKKFEVKERYSKKEQAIIKLLELDIEPSIAQKTVEKIIENEKNDLEVKDIVFGAIRLLSNTKNKKKLSDFRNDETNEDDLRVIVENGLKNKISAYASLKEYGYIKEFNTILLGDKI
ncbi:ATP-binding protein [Candidatus Clostridium radicumherbarum]|uniref:ATP-binding protein n=1 Tax=Candidatus Clostridium radicumherbarum TaxID=3381662 RepID=A0ABW8TWZ3_9CLOT